MTVRERLIKILDDILELLGLVRRSRFEANNTHYIIEIEKLADRCADIQTTCSKNEAELFKINRELGEARANQQNLAKEITDVRYAARDNERYLNDIVYPLYGEMQKEFERTGHITLPQTAMQESTDMDSIFAAKLVPFYQFVPKTSPDGDGPVEVNIQIKCPTKEPIENDETLLDTIGALPKAGKILKWLDHKNMLYDVIANLIRHGVLSFGILKRDDQCLGDGTNEAFNLYLHVKAIPRDDHVFYLTDSQVDDN